MRKATAALLLAIWAAGALGQDGPGAPGRASGASGPSAADRLAAESLRNSALGLVHSPAGTIGRAGRLVAMVRFADRLEPGHPQTHWMLANIYESQGRLKLAAESVAHSRADRRSDHALAVRWLRLQAEALKPNADDGVEFFRSVVARKDLPASARAEAAFHLARLYEVLGSKEALKTYEFALSLDAHHPGALNGRLELLKVAGKDTPLERIRTMLGLLGGNPRAGAAAWKAAVQLDRLGLYEQALELFDHCAAAAGTDRSPEALSDAFIVNHLNALLDAGRARQAVETYEPMRERFADSVDFRTLLLEAYRALDEKTKATVIVKAMEIKYKPREGAAAMSASLATELAWFYLLTVRRPKSALVHARQAALLKPDNPIVQRILGAAELLSGQEKLVAAGEKRLRKLHQKDLHAAAFLAEHYYARRDAVSGKSAVLAGAAIGRSGPAYRRLLRVARAHEVAIPAAAGGVEARALLKAFDKRYFQMARSPAGFLAASVSPVAKQVAPGEPVEVDVTLANRGELDLPLGDWGLCSPVVALKVTVSGGGTFADLPLATCPAPRYLPAGETVRLRVRLDVGRLAAFLAARPLEQITLTVTGVLDPVQRGEKVDSALPGVRVAAAEIVRTGLLGAFDRTNPDRWRRTYQRTLGLIVRDMKRGAIHERMRAARRVAALLALARRVETGQAKAPKPLDGVFGKPVLLSMLRAVLRDPSEVVRAEMLAALGHVRLDKATLSLLGPAVQDRSALVRFRLVNLLGASEMPGQEPLLDHLAGDPHDMVRLMASAFQNRRT